MVTTDYKHHTLFLCRVCVCVCVCVCERERERERERVCGWVGGWASGRACVRACDDRAVLKRITESLTITTAQGVQVSKYRTRLWLSM